MLKWCIRIWRTYLHVFLARQRYYFGWYLAEAGFVACGADYNGHNADGSINWFVVTHRIEQKIELYD
jgi:hypothetical protein